MAVTSKGNVLPMPSVRNAARKAALDEVKAALRPYLRRYLEEQGVIFDQRNGKYHCFNQSDHAHGDKDASASLDPKRNGEHFKCFACGISGDIFEACRRIEGKPTTGKEFIDTIRYLADRFDVPFPDGEIASSRKPSNNVSRELTNEYLYTDSKGQPLYKVRRFILKQYDSIVTDDAGKAKKEFLPMIYRGNDQWASGYGDAERVLYHLPETLQAIAAGEPVFFVEGEKCADIIRDRLGLAATTIAGGSNAWIKPHTANYIRDLARAQLIILTDNDNAGRKFGEMVANDVVAIVSSIRLIELPGLPPKGDIEQWLQHLPDDTPEQQKKKLLAIAASTKEWAREKPAEAFKNPIFISNRIYFREGGKQGPVPISNFTVHPLHRIVPDGADPRTAQWNVRVETEDGVSFEQVITLEAFINRLKFRQAFPHESVNFFGNDDDLQGVKLLFGREAYDSKRGVQYIGFHADKEDGQSLFVSHTQAIHADGTQADNVMLMDGAERIMTDILETSTATADEIPALVKALFSFNSREKCAVLVGWICGCFLKEYFRKAGIKYPHLFIYGEAGSGKSQTVESVLMPIFSIGQKFSAGQLTKFSALASLSSSNTIPFIIDEYKPAFIGDGKVKDISELLRNAYDQQTVQRGHHDQTITTYTLRAPICLIGEEGSDETANKERGLELLFSKMALAQDGFRSSFYFIKENREAISRLGRTLLSSAMKLDTETARLWHQTAMDNIEGQVRTLMPGMPDRVASSIGCCIAGLFLLDQTLAVEDLSLTDIIGQSFEDLIASILEAVYLNIMDGQSSPKSTVSRILEVMDLMADGTYREGKHFTFLNNGTQIALDITGMYDEYKKYRRDHDLKGDSLERNQFAKQLKNMAFYVAYRNVRFKGDYAGATASVRRAYVLDIELLQNEVDLRNFIPAQLRPKADA